MEAPIPSSTIQVTLRGKGKRGERHGTLNIHVNYVGQLDCYRCVLEMVGDVKGLPDAFAMEGTGGDPVQPEHGIQPERRLRRCVVDINIEILKKMNSYIKNKPITAAYRLRRRDLHKSIPCFKVLRMESQKRKCFHLCLVSQAYQAVLGLAAVASMTAD